MARKKISDKSDQRRRAKVLVGKVDGKPVYKWASGRTVKELEANKEELLRRYINGATSAVQRDVLFGVYAQQWYDTYKKPGLSRGSRGSHASTFNVHLFPVFGNRQLRAITAAELQEFVNTKAGMGSSTIGYICSDLTDIFRTATAAGIVDRDPTLCLTNPPASKKERRALTDAERSAALKVGEEDPEGLLLLLLYYTGMRIGELIGLQWQDVDFAGRYIHVRRDVDYKANAVDTVKTPSSLRSIPLPAPLANALDPVRGVGTAFVLQGPETGSFLPQATYNRRWRRLRIAMLEADNSIESRVVHTRKVRDPETHKFVSEMLYGSMLTAHYFRHNYASILYDAGVDVLSAHRFLGHKDVKTTLAIYTHLSQGKADVNAERVRAIFAGENESCQKVAKTEGGKSIDQKAETPGAR